MGLILKLLFLIAWIGFVVWLVFAARQAVQNNAVPLSADFLIGIAFGMMLGMIVTNTLDSLFLALFDPHQVNRLMLRYHDELAALKGEPGPRGPGCDESAGNQHDDQ